MSTNLQFSPIHIDVARNATDDFNPFHDKHRWQNVVGNPFPGPILLGFQLECLLEDQLRQFRQQHGEHQLIEQHALRYSNYDFKFVSAVSCEQQVRVSIKPSQFRQGDNPTLGNRVALYADNKLAVAGFKRESNLPLVDGSFEPDPSMPLLQVPDRSFVGTSGMFLKRKYMTTSNAKNFLSSALVEQSDYIDEIADKVSFPEIFPCALLSCALLERAVQQGHDFEREPLIYQSHALSVDRQQLSQLRSNDVLHLLSRLDESSTDNSYSYDCWGVIGDNRLLFSARLQLHPLAIDPA